MSEIEQGYGAAMFRKHWQEHQSAAAMPGDLVSQPRWIDSGLTVLATMLVAGVVLGGTVTVARTEALPAVAQGSAVTAARTGDRAPELGATVQFRDAAGTSHSAVVIEVTGTEIVAQLPDPGRPAVGELILPAKSERLISLLVPRLW